MLPMLLLACEAHARSYYGQSAGSVAICASSSLTPPQASISHFTLLLVRGNMWCLARSASQASVFRYAYSKTLCTKQLCTALDPMPCQQEVQEAQKNKQNCKRHTRKVCLAECSVLSAGMCHTHAVQHHQTVCLTWRINSFGVLLG